jgi:ADP-ribose pyrophosphatase
MDQEVFPEQVVWSSKWFEIIARQPPSYAEPHYSIRTTDYVGIVATDEQQRFLLVRQLRPAVGRATLEIPCGHVERGQTPEEAVRQELLEETGHIVEHLYPLGSLSPDTGRYGNRMWCFFASGARPSPDRAFAVEDGIDLVLYQGTVRSLINEREFDSALNHAVVLAALARGHLHV